MGQTVDEVPEEPVVEETPTPPIKKGRKSSLNNPVKESEIDVISSSIVADRCKKQITKNAKDERYKRLVFQYQDLEQAMLVRLLELKN